jgi:hypothetical protein
MTKGDLVLVNDLIEISKLDRDPTVNAFKLGLIRGKCEQYLSDHSEEKEYPFNEVDSEDSGPVTTGKVLNRSENPSKSCTDDEKKPTFEEFCKQEAEKSDDYIIKLLERRASHMNLKFEISKRWVSDNTCKFIMKMLNDKGIVTMSDFVTIFDDPDMYNALLYPQSVKSELRNKLYSKFPKDLQDSDRKKFADLYNTANDVPSDKDPNGVGISSINMLRNFLCPEAKLNDAYASRYVNGFVRNGINNINQLYFFLQKNGLNAVTKIKGVGHISESIVALYAKMKEA